MRIAVPREITPRETRVALVPETVARLIKSGFEVLVESGAGALSSFPDEAYREAGASIAPNEAAALASADLVVKVREPIAIPAGGHEADLVREGAVLIAFLGRDKNSDAATRLAARGVRAFSMEMVPRISRAQKMDALSSMSTVAGYKAALLGANALGRFYPLLMTAAGTIAPAHVFVLGAGVAGLQAIATSRRLGAVVEAFDVRPAVREEVQSLGGTFIAAELVSESAVDKGGYAKALGADQEERVRQVIAEHLKHTDVAITTAMIPGRKAPVMITAAMVKDMKPGSAIVDIAADMGGNCELTRPGETIVVNGVSVLGPLNLAASLPTHASQMYSRNVAALVVHLAKDGKLNLDFADEITRESCITGAPQPAPEMAAARSGA
jgi:NAD(P) transhydrogenase subunit alpha